MENFDEMKPNMAKSFWPPVTHNRRSPCPPVLWEPPRVAYEPMEGPTMRPVKQVASAARWGRHHTSARICSRPELDLELGCMFFAVLNLIHCVEPTNSIDILHWPAHRLLKAILENVGKQDMHQEIIRIHGWALKSMVMWCASTYVIGALDAVGASNSDEHAERH